MIAENEVKNASGWELIRFVDLTKSEEIKDTDRYGVDRGDKRRWQRERIYSER